MPVTSLGAVAEKMPEETIAAAAATTSTVTSPEAKTSRLSPEQEQILLRFFGAQDRVDREEAFVLARQVHTLTLLSLSGLRLPAVSSMTQLHPTPQSYLIPARLSSPSSS